MNSSEGTDRNSRRETTWVSLLLSRTTFRRLTQGFPPPGLPASTLSQRLCSRRNRLHANGKCINLGRNTCVAPPREFSFRLSPAVPVCPFRRIHQYSKVLGLLEGLRARLADSTSRGPVGEHREQVP